MSPKTARFLPYIFLSIGIIVPVVVRMPEKYVWLYSLLAIGLFWIAVILWARYSKDPQMLAEREDKKRALEEIRQSPDFRRLRILQVFALIALAVVVIVSFLTKNLILAEFIAPIIVFGFMMYYARILQRHRKTAGYGTRLEEVERSGFKTFAVIAVMRIWIWIVGILLVSFLLYWLILRNQL